MAQLASLQVRIDVQDARRAIKRVMREATEANRQLARLEERLDEYSARLASYGIRLEVDDGGHHA